MNKNYLAAMSLEALSELGEARQRWVSTAVNLVTAERVLGLVEADAKREITEAAGGPKALGSNADLREQALTVALASHEGYLLILMHHSTAFEEEARAKQAMYTLIDTERLFRTLLETGAFTDLVPADAAGDLVVSDETPLWEWLPIGE